MRGFSLFLVAVLVVPARADSLESAELKELRAYLAGLKAGQASDAAQVERLAGVSFAGLLEAMKAYAALESPTESHTHRAFQVLLERTSREALSPWPVVQLYSPELARFLSRTPGENPLARDLLARLLQSDNARLAVDLGVRLAPATSLEHLASGKKDKRAELFDAWNRRLALARETRPLPGLEPALKKIAESFSLDLPGPEIEAHLRFLGSWPDLQESYRRQLKRALTHDTPSIVQAGLAVQHRLPEHLGLNEELIQRWKDHPRLVEQALRNYAFDESQDHSATLRRLWSRLPTEQTRARYQCLFSMGIHSRGNDGIALEAVQAEAFELIDVALPVLRRGDPEKARRAVQHVLTKSERGHEEALRLARSLKLTGFEENALRIALDDQRDQILRQTAMLYLSEAEGKYRRQLLPCLAYPKGDLRLTAIRAFASKQGLAAEDVREIGPTLIRVAQVDPSMGHRQEALYALGCWKAPQTLEFFRKILADNPAVILSEGYYSDARYWQYRFRLMGLLGLARLGEKSARQELLQLHGKGSPAEKMDVLLAFLDLGEVPDVAFADLDSLEPRLVATAAQLIASHGDAKARDRLRKKFADEPLWKEFRRSGIDDYNILRIVGESGNGSSR